MRQHQINAQRMKKDYDPFLIYELHERLYPSL